MKNIIFIGNSIANSKAIEEIRKRDKESSMTLVSVDAFHPYGRDRSLAFLAREIKEKQVFYRPEAFYKEHNVRMITNQPITRFNFKRNQVFLENKEQLVYDILVLADLAAPRLPEIKGHHKAGVYHTVRLADVKAIAEQAMLAETVVVQVNSLFGFLTLCALSHHVKELIVSSTSSGILAEILDPESSSILKQIMEYHGVRLMLDNPIEEIFGDSEVKAVRLRSGKVLSTEMVILDDVRLDMRPFQDAGLSTPSEGGLSGFQSNFSNVYWVDAVLNAFKINGDKHYSTPLEALEWQGIALAREILGDQPLAIMDASHIKFRMKNLTGFWFGATRCSQGDRELCTFDAQKNVYKKIFSNSDVLTGAIFFNADEQLSKISSIFNEKVNIQGIEDQILEGHFDLQYSKSPSASG